MTPTSLQDCSTPSRFFNTTQNSRQPLRLALDGIVVECEGRFVAVSLPTGRQFVPCAPRDLETFSRFAKVVRDYLGLEVTHASQGHASFAERLAFWRAAVASAAKRGGAA